MIKHIGDMAFIEVPHGKNQSTDQTKTRRNAILHSSALWPDARVPYTISSDFSGKMICDRLVVTRRDLDYKCGVSKQGRIQGVVLRG